MPKVTLEAIRAAVAAYVKAVAGTPVAAYVKTVAGTDYRVDVTSADYKKLQAAVKDEYRCLEAGAEIPTVEEVVQDLFDTIGGAEFGITETQVTHASARTYLIEINEKQRELLARAARHLVAAMTRVTATDDEEELDTLADMLDDLATKPGEPGDLHDFAHDAF